MHSVLKIALLSAALLTSCGEKTVSQSSRLSEEQAAQLSRAFERLDQILARKAPTISSRLHPGSSEDDLDKLRTCLNGNQIEILEKWFTWHNGAGEKLLPAGMPISVDRSVEDQRILESIPFVPPVRRNSVKILDDLDGNGFFLDVNSENPLVFHHILEEPENPVWFGTLPEFVDFIASGFESGVLFENEDGKFDYDGAEYEEFMSEYLERATRWN